MRSRLSRGPAKPSRDSAIKLAWGALTLAKVLLQQALPAIEVVEADAGLISFAIVEGGRFCEDRDGPKGRIEAQVVGISSLKAC